MVYATAEAFLCKKCLEESAQGHFQRSQVWHILGPNMFTISISASFTSALSRNNFTSFVLSNFCSIHLVSGHRSLYSCIKKAEIIMRAVKFYIQDMGSLKQSVPFSSAFKCPSSFFLAVSPSRQIRKYKTMLKLQCFF